MEITLEKIELVKDRTGVTYREAKEALEAMDGSVVDAIIAIEESINYDTYAAGKKASMEDKEFVRKVREIVSKGNMSKIIIKKDGETLLNLPLTVSLVGAVIAPWGVVFAVIAAAGFRCEVEFMKHNGEIVDINGKVKDKYDTAVDKGMAVKEKSRETIDKIKDSEIYNGFKEKSSDAIEKIKDSDFYNDVKYKGSDMIYDIKDRGSEMFDDIKERRENVIRRTKEDVVAPIQAGFEDVKKSASSNIDEIKKNVRDLGKDLKKEDDEMGIKEDAKEAAKNIKMGAEDLKDEASKDAKDVAKKVEKDVEHVADKAEDVMKDSKKDIEKAIDEVEKELKK